MLRPRARPTDRPSERPSGQEKRQLARSARGKIARSLAYIIPSRSHDLCRPHPRAGRIFADEPTPLVALPNFSTDVISRYIANAKPFRRLLFMDRGSTTNSYIPAGSTTLIFRSTDLNFYIDTSERRVELSWIFVGRKILRRRIHVANGNLRKPRVYIHEGN